MVCADWKQIIYTPTQPSRTSTPAAQNFIFSLHLILFLPYIPYLSFQCWSLVAIMILFLLFLDISLVYSFYCVLLLISFSCAFQCFVLYVMYSFPSGYFHPFFFPYFLKSVVAPDSTLFIYILDANIARKNKSQEKD